VREVFNDITANRLGFFSRIAFVTSIKVHVR
jgi:hypothetical protein